MTSGNDKRNDPTSQNLTSGDFPRDPSASVDFPGEFSGDFSGDFSDEFDAAAVVSLTSALVRLRTVHDRGAAQVESPAVDLLAAVMRGFDWDVTVTEVAPGRPNVVAEVRGARPGRTLMFEGHLDVVTEVDPDLWSFDPYGGEVVNGRLQGRGSADMKSGVAAMVHAARAVQLGGFDGRIVIGALADEEGMMLGAKYFAGEVRAGLWGDIDGVIVCEPEGGEVCPVAKGAIRMQVELTGAMAHGAMPQMGRNPVPAVGSLLLGLDQIEQAIRGQTGTHPLLGEFSLTPTVLRAGSPDQINVIPATASLSLDIRTVPGVDHRMLIDLITRLSDTLAAESALDSRVTVIDDRPPVDTAIDAPVVRAMFDGHQAATGQHAVLGGVPGTTDGTILTRDAGLPTVVYGPGGKWIAHQADEYVEVEEILISTRAYISAARHFLGAPRR